MMTDQREVLSILVVCEDADQYRPMLEADLAPGARVDYACEAESARKRYRQHQILLAQPDMAAELVDQMVSIRWVQSTWAGITPLLNTRRQDYLITGVKGVFGRQMAEYTLAHLLAHEQRLLERYRHQQQNVWWDEFSGLVHGKTLGVMGTGSIGTDIAQLASQFGLRVLGFSRSGEASEGFERVWPLEQLNEFLAIPDYVVAVLPDTPETTGLMTTGQWAVMQKHAVFINVGRGNLVDEKSLVSALESGELAAAVLDVVRTEPLPEQSPLWSAPRLTITGHIAAYSRPQDIAAIFLDNLNRFTQGQSLQFEVKRNRGY